MSEDVLDKVDELMTSGLWNFEKIAKLIPVLQDLAAEVRELRKDRERLDRLETIIAMRKIVGGPWEGVLPTTRAISAHSLRDLASLDVIGFGSSERDAIDAAMEGKARKG